MKRKSRTKIVKRVNAFLIALVMILTSIQIPVKGAIKQDYGSITLSDIILAWYNASGVAIGNTQIANAIQSAYGGISLDDLVDAEVLYSDYIGIEGGDLKEMLGYGNLSAPLIKVNLGRLRDYLPDLPTTDVAYKALNAMFTWENSTWFENNLGAIIGTVANIGKIAYSFGTDILNEIVDTNLSLPWQERVTLRDIYRNFTDSTYFQDLLQNSSSGGDEGEWTIVDENGNIMENYGAVIIYDNNGNPSRSNIFIGTDNNQFGIMTVNKSTGGVRIGICDINLTTDSTTRWTSYEGIASSIDDLNKTIIVRSNKVAVDCTGWFTVRQVFQYDARYTYIPVGKIIIVPDISNMTNEQIRQYAIDNNPWGTSSGGGGGTGNGVTDYINKEAGNITEENYQILSPNINVGEYMYLADGSTYIETLNQITNNTDNGDYSQNGDVITNYNNTYIQNTLQETRPTVAPAQSPIPAQPFISPRPTQPPESYEAVIHQGGIPETIKQKFPFCIPWDLAAVLQNLWAPEARAPYIHWDATFGSWGKLGEVDLDFSIFNDAARIFRATTLILWIIGLVVITRNIIGG